MVEGIRDSGAPQESPDAAAIPAGELEGISPIYMGRLYVFALVWSVGAFLEREDRWLFDAHVRSNFSSLPLPPKTKSKEDTIFDFVVGADGNNHNNVTKDPDDEFDNLELLQLQVNGITGRTLYPIFNTQSQPSSTLVLCWCPT